MQKIFIVMILLTGAFAQTEKNAPPPIKTIRHLARLSYKNTYGIDWQNDKLSPSICFKLEKNGDYEIARSNSKRETQILKGTLSAQQISEISDRLRDLESTQDRFGGARVLRGSEVFTAEINEDDQPVHLTWINADHAIPFPQSIVRMIDWLQAFEPATTAVGLTTPDPTICPGWSEPLRPKSASAPCVGSGFTGRSYTQ